MIERIYKEFPVDPIIQIESLYTFFNEIFPYDYLFQGERHDFLEVICVISGNAGITADHNIYKIKKGNLFIHKPGEYHKIWSNNSEVEVIIFSFKSKSFPILSSRLFELSENQIEILQSLWKEANEGFFLEGINVIGIKDNFKASIVIKKLELFLLDITSSAGTQLGVDKSKSAEKFRLIIQYLMDNLNAKVDTEIISKSLNMSVPAIELVMHKYAGCGVSSYFLKMKLNKAKEYISSGKSVKETALKLGFSNQNYFSACYKKYFGYSPTKENK